MDPVPQSILLTTLLQTRARSQVGRPNATRDVEQERNQGENHRNSIDHQVQFPDVSSPEKKSVVQVIAIRFIKFLTRQGPTDNR